MLDVCKVFFQSSWVRNLFCKILFVGVFRRSDLAFNPREWGTCFARKKKFVATIWSGHFQSSWVRNLFCKNRAHPRPRNVSFSFNPREWGTCFARLNSTPLTRSWTRLSILVSEELVLQGITKPSVTSWSFFFQSSWVRNLFCKKLIEELKKMANASFNPREWGTCFARAAAVAFPPSPKVFQSSWVRNLFCKHHREVVLSQKGLGLSILVSEELVLQEVCGFDFDG